MSITLILIRPTLSLFNMIKVIAVYQVQNEFSRSAGRANRKQMRSIDVINHIPESLAAVVVGARPEGLLHTRGAVVLVH